MKSSSEKLYCHALSSMIDLHSRESWRWILLLFFTFIFFSQKTIAQSACPTLTVSPNTSICNGCTPLTATVQGTRATTSYSVSTTAYSPLSYNTGTTVLLGIDDTWSTPITIPFCFQFYGTSYTQLLIGSNGIITFDLSNAGGFCPWSLSGSPIPDASLPTNSIMGIYEDIDPTHMGDIYYQTTGTAPCRAFVVSFYHVPHYGDPNSVSTSDCGSPLFATYQIVLYETTNIIDINVADKESCSGWNGGYGIEGIQDAAGANAVTVAGRNNTVWTATNDAYRFTPTGAPNYTVTWYNPSNTAIGTTPTISVCPTVTTTYTATVVNTTCSSPITISNTVTVTVTPPPCSTPPPCTFIAHGDTVCVGSTIFLTADTVTNVSYKWTGPNGFVSSVRNPSIANAILAQTGWYFVKDSIPGCSSTDSVFVKVNAGSVANAGPDQTICTGGGSTVTLAGTIVGSATSGTWSGGAGTYNPNNTTATAVYTPSTAEETAGTVTLTYIPNGTGGSCPEVSDQMIISIKSPPTANAGSTQSVCPGATFTLAGAIGGAATGGTWSGGTGTYSPDNTTLNAVYTPSPAEYAADSVMLTLTTDDPPGPCTFSTSTVTFHFYQVPVVNFAVDTANGCPTHCTGFTNSSLIGGGDNITTWYWNFGDNHPGSDLPTPNHCFPQSGYYDITLTATSNHGCVSSLTQPQMVHVYNVPIAQFSPSPSTASIIDPTIIFNNQSSSDVSYWHWNFGDSTTLAPSTSSPVHIYPDSVSAYYWVTLIVHNAGGCYDTVKHQIYIEPGFTFYIPNSFSPNGNGVNDYFFGSGTGIKNYDLWIFDRWGNMVFHTSELTEKWDGSKKDTGTDSDLMDVYVWKVAITDVINKKHDYIGTVTIVK